MTKSQMTKSQMMAALKKMGIQDAVQVVYCNVLNCYEIRVDYENLCKSGYVRTREMVVKKAEQWYCDLIAASY